MATRRFTFLHGFTQTHHHWYRGAAAIDAALGTRGSQGQFSFVDLPGHGRSQEPTDFRADAADLAEAIGPTNVVGYSMGGRLALAGAIERPGLVNSIILIGATAGLPPDEADARRRLDEQRARDLERDGLATFLDRWLSAPMFTTLPTRGLDHRRRNRATGLAASLRRHGTGSQPSYWDRLDEVRCRVLCIVGEHDIKFRMIAERLADGLPRADIAVIADAGHACHIERPTATAAAIAAWI